MKPSRGASLGGKEGQPELPAASLTGRCTAATAATTTGESAAGYGWRAGPALKPWPCPHPATSSSQPSNEDHAHSLDVVWLQPGPSTCRGTGTQVTPLSSSVEPGQARAEEGPEDGEADAAKCSSAAGRWWRKAGALGPEPQPPRTPCLWGVRRVSEQWSGPGTR